jgi:Mg-chelatase subunit ChlD
MSKLPREVALRRWRLALGRYGQQTLDASLRGEEARMDRALDFLYGREYARRGVRESDGTARGAGSLDPSQLQVPTWLNEVRELFPRETAEIVEKHALERYELTELVTDPVTLGRLEPNVSLLKMLLTLRGRLQGPVLDAARKVVRHVVEDIRKRLEHEVRRTLAGRLNRFRHSPLALRQNLDALGTVRANLKHYDRERRKLMIERVRFFDRNTRRLPWTVILCVDQSGSMAGSVIHSAVLAAILAGLPSLSVKLVVFDTSVVDLSDRVDDPVEALMSVQLGGGTDIAKAMRYCEQLIAVPHRTIVALVTDFGEGGSPADLVAVCRRMAEARVRLLGLAALDEAAAPAYDKDLAGKLAAIGMEIAALTPQRLAQWLVKVIS